MFLLLLQTQYLCAQRIANLESGLAICLFRQPENRQNHNNVTLWMGWHQKKNRYPVLKCFSFLFMKTMQRALYSFIFLSFCSYNTFYSYVHNKFYFIIVIFYFTFIFSPLSLLPLTSLTF